MKYFIITIALLTFSPILFAQSFSEAIGARMGVTPGFFYDKQNEDLTTFRYMISTRKDGAQFTMIKLRQLYKMDQLPDDFSFYYGYGAHLGYIRWSESVTSPDKGYYWANRSAPVIGLDGLVGISYDMRRMPLSITLDAKPFFDLWGKHIFNPMPFDVAFGIVYNF